MSRAEGNARLLLSDFLLANLPRKLTYLKLDVKKKKKKGMVDVKKNKGK